MHIHIITGHTEYLSPAASNVIHPGCAFYFAWYAALVSGEPTDAFEECCRAMRIMFELLPSKEGTEIRKWALAEESFALADTQVLQGLKRARAIKQFEQNLKHDGKKCEHEALEKMFSSGGISSMSARVIGTLLKVAERFEAVPAASLSVSALDSSFGNTHALTSHSNLDILCGKTAIRSDPLLQNALFLARYWSDLESAIQQLL